MASIGPAKRPAKARPAKKKEILVFEALSQNELMILPVSG